MDSVYSKEIKSYWEKETKKKLEKEKRLDDFLEMIAEKYNELVVEVSNPKVLDALILVEKEAGIGWEEHFVAVLAECGILLPESSTEEFGSVDKGKEIFPKTVLYRRKSYSVEDGLKVLRSEHSGMLIPEEAIDRTQLKEFYSSQNSRILITNDGSVIYKQSNSGFEKRIINEILNTIHLDDAGYPTGVIGYMESPPTLVYRHRKGLPLKRLIGQLKPLGRAIIVVHLFDLISNLHSFGWVHRDISLSNIICNLKVSPEELNEPSSVNLELIDFECAQRINTAITVANKTPHFSHKSNGQIGLQVSVEQDWYSYGWACLLVSKNTLNIKSILSTISTSNKGISVGRHYANEKLKIVLKSHDMEEKFAFMAAIIKLSTSHPSTGELGLKTNELLDVLK